MAGELIKKSDITPESIGALPTAGGTMTGTLTLNSALILNSSMYGTTYPSNPVVGQIFFWKAT